MNNSSIKLNAIRKQILTLAKISDKYYDEGKYNLMNDINLSLLKLYDIEREFLNKEV